MELGDPLEDAKELGRRIKAIRAYLEEDQAAAGYFPKGQIRGVQCRAREHSG